MPRRSAESAGPQPTPAQWRDNLGFLPFVGRRRVKNLLARHFEQAQRHLALVRKAEDRLAAIRELASVSGNTHLPDMRRIIDRCRVGNMFGSDVTQDAFCSECRLAWPCPTFRLAHEVTQVTYGWPSVELPRATITIEFGER